MFDTTTNFIRIYVKRLDVSIGRRIFNPILFVFLALFFCGIFLAALGFNPFTVYGKMLRTICSHGGITRSIQAGLPLMFTGLAVAFGYRMNLNNIGADGQYAQSVQVWPEGDAEVIFAR